MVTAPNEFNSLVEAFYVPLCRFAMSLARDETTAADLTQQTFLKWARFGDQLRDRTKAKTWLFTTLHREFLALRRKADRMEDRELDEIPAPAPAASASDKIDAQLALAALQQVDEVYRAPVAMFYLQDMSYAEIAEALDIPIGTVMSRLARGRDKLRTLLSHTRPKS